MPTNSFISDSDKEKIKSWILNLKVPIVNYTAQFIELETIETKKLEKDENISVKVQINKVAESDIEIAFSAIGNATIGLDYALINSKVQIAKGTNQGVLEYKILADSDYESIENINFNLLQSEGEGYQVSPGDFFTFKHIIEDDEQAGEDAVKQDALDNLALLKSSLEMKNLESQTHQSNAITYSNILTGNVALSMTKKTDALSSSDISNVQAIFYELQAIKQNSDTLKALIDKIIEDKATLSNSVDSYIELSRSYANKLDEKLATQDYLINKVIFDQIQIVLNNIDIKLTNYPFNYAQVLQNFEQVGTHLNSLKLIASTSFPDYLVAYYSFDNQQWLENSIQDNTGNNHNLSVIGATKTDNGKFEQAINLDGSDDLAHTRSINSDDWSEFTILAWINPNELGDVRVFTKSSSTAQADHIVSLAIRNGSIRLRVATDGTGGKVAQYDSPDGLIKVNEWMQIGASWSSSKNEIKLYHNGIVVSTFSHEGESIKNSLEPFVLGNVNLSEDRYYNGAIDEVSVFNKAISDDDVLLLSFKTVKETYTDIPTNDGVALQTGTILYNNNCLSCHNALDISDKRGKSFIQIKEALSGISVMKDIKLNNAEIKEIEKALDTIGEISRDDRSLAYDCSINDYKNALPNKLRKLSKTELVNTYKSLVSGLTGINIEAELSLIPEDPEQLAEDYQYEMPNSHFETFTTISSNIAYKISSNDLYTSALAGECSLETNVSETCLKSFIANFGLRAYRRPLQNEEINFLYNLTTNENIQINNDKFMIVLMAMLQSPNLLFIYDTTKPIEQIEGENIEKRNQYETASLISYALTQSPPDQSLLSAAAANELDSVENLKLHANRLIFSPSGRENIKSFIYDWLELYRASDPSSGSAFLNGIDGTGLKYEAISSAKEFGAKVIVDRQGTLEELLSGNEVYVNTHKLARLYGITEWSPSELVTVSNDRAGILATPAMTMDGGFYSSIISRGVRVRRRVLCDTLPSPDFASIQSRKNIPTPSRSIASNRHYWTQFTMEDDSCLACHKSINHIGHIFEKIDSMGRTRTYEKVYNETGTEVTNVHKIVTHDSPEIYIGDTLKVDNAKDLGLKIATTSKAKSCFIRKVFEYTFKTKYQHKYSCFLSSIENEFKDDKSKMIDVFVNLIANKYSLAKRSSD